MGNKNSKKKCDGNIKRGGSQETAEEPERMGRIFIGDGKERHFNVRLFVGTRVLMVTLHNWGEGVDGKAAWEESWHSVYRWEATIGQQGEAEAVTLAKSGLPPTSLV